VFKSGQKTFSVHFDTQRNDHPASLDQRAIAVLLPSGSLSPMFSRRTPEQKKRLAIGGGGVLADGLSGITRRGSQPDCRTRHHH
jgi:hypothetical protein